jgi:hypothetical protein
MEITHCSTEDNQSDKLKLCFSCNRVCGEDGKWVRRANMSIPNQTPVSYGLCLECCENTYFPLNEMKKILLESQR